MAVLLNEEAGRDAVDIRKEDDGKQDVGGYQ